MSALPYPAPADLRASAPAASCAPAGVIGPVAPPALSYRVLPRRRHLADARAYSYPPPVPHVPWAAQPQPLSLRMPVRQLPTGLPPVLVPVASSVDNDRSGVDLTLLGTGGVN